MRGEPAVRAREAPAGGLLVRLPAGPGAVRRAESAVLGLAAGRLPAERRPPWLAVRTGVRETVANAVLHGGGRRRGPLLEAAVERRPRPGRLRVTVVQADPLEVTRAGPGGERGGGPDPGRAGSGRGLVLVRGLADAVRFDVPRRRVTLWFDLPRA